METDERDLTPDKRESNADQPSDAIVLSDDARFAPPTEAQKQAEIVETENDTVEGEIIENQPTENADAAVTDGMDIEAALAAVSTLSDMVAEQEAAEQARIAEIEAEAQAAAEREARLQHPELFFPVPPMSSLHRGQMTSVIPALLLIVMGAWLTFTLTTTKAAPDMMVLAVIAGGGIGITLLARWLGSGRWARGSLFFGLIFLLLAGSAFYLSQPGSPGWTQGWPVLLIAAGIAFMLTGLLAIPRNGRLVLPGLALIVAGIAGFVITLGVLSGEVITTIGTLWPAAVALVVVIWALPLIFRQRG
jgi:hypothetical protein